MARPPPLPLASDVSAGTERLLFTTLRRLDSVYSCAFSPDGKVLACSHWDLQLTLWDVETLTCQATLRGHDELWPRKLMVHSCAFSPDGKALASASQDTTLRLCGMWRRAPAW